MVLKTECEKHSQLFEVHADAQKVGLKSGSTCQHNVQIKISEMNITSTK